MQRRKVNIRTYNHVPVIIMMMMIIVTIATYGSITFEVKLPSACSFIVDGLVFFCRCSHYMFRPIWPSSGVYDILLFSPEGICFAAFVAFVACCYIMQFLICVCFCCVSVNFHILVQQCNRMLKYNIMRHMVLIRRTSLAPNSQLPCRQH
jgi:hypothetical protein